MRENVILEFYNTLVSDIAKEVEHNLYNRLMSNFKVEHSAGQDKDETSKNQSTPQNFTIKDAAAYFRVSRSTIDRAISSGRLKCYKFGKQSRIKREWILEFEEEIINKSNRSKGER